MENQIKIIPDKQNDSRTSFNPHARTVAGSGAAMDIKIEQSGKKLKRIFFVSIIVIFLAGTIWSFMSLKGERSFKLSADNITISRVTKGIFEDYIPIRGRIIPRTTVFLDAIEGGRVDRVYAEDGDVLKQGDIIVSLTNSSLQLQVTNAEAQVAEQLNNMRTIELSLEQNRLNNARAIVDIEHRIRTLERDLVADRQRGELGFLSKKELLDKENELIYQQNLFKLLKESQKTDERLQRQQLEAQRVASARLEQNLVTARKNLDDLNIRAPIGESSPALMPRLVRILCRAAA
jgi:HlyD family secretion protein